MQGVADRLLALKEAVSEEALKVNRKSEDITIVVVTKTISLEKILEAYEAGCRDFGENRVQELLDKKKSLPKDIRWHLIGQLQTNKVKQIVKEVALIHSLDRDHLVIALEKEAVKQNISEVPCLIQINTSREISKSGISPENLKDLVSKIGKTSPVKIRGLMTIGPLDSKETSAEKCFQEAYQLRAKMKQEFPQHDWSVLSMGMSGDYVKAIREGSTMIRIGTAVFGERNS